jgi:hypothetical protein
MEHFFDPKTNTFDLGSDTNYVKGCKVKGTTMEAVRPLDRPFSEAEFAAAAFGSGQLLEVVFS